MCLCLCRDSEERDDTRVFQATAARYRRLHELPTEARDSHSSQPSVETNEYLSYRVGHVQRRIKV